MVMKMEWEDRGDGDMDKDMPTSLTSGTVQSVDSEFWLGRVPEVSSLEEQLRELKPDGMDEAEIEELAMLIRWILEYEPSRRPSVEAILAHPWFSS
ncbi:hypothetical protein C8A05DRAFT_38488 [Staphylotrichum tortipilum]|uniref:Protein kinase domain-containing protein n=1 Tax=Staphylotrichum tortipilum TaxID=2831512 RepID=A0AAN6MCT2_9PEZI|nr:hypothetical protein C8A05DRAFT_38488 [Staphylotrichum longicolle]